MARVERVPTGAGTVRVVFTSRADGDFRVDLPPAELEPRRAGLVSRPWTWLRQVHGPDVVLVTAPGEGAGTEADGAVTTAPGCPLAVTTADCAPVVLVADGGFAVVHAGWRGLVAGVIDRAAGELARVGGEPVATLIGPCIGPAAYEFGPADLDEAARALGSEVRSTTAWGTPALDVPQAVAAVCRRLGWPEPVGQPPCTSDERWFSHRVRAEAGRQATVAWLERPGAAGAAGAGDGAAERVRRSEQAEQAAGG